MTERDSEKIHSTDAFRLALTGLKDYHTNKSDQARNNASLVWKELITDQLLESALKIPEMPGWRPPESTGKNLNYAPVELTGLIQKWTDGFNTILIRQCFSILRYQKRLLCPESYWRILSVFDNKPDFWILLNEVLGPEADFLAKKNAKWRWWIEIKTDRSWISKDLNIRLKYFSFLRQTEPRKAIDLLTRSWMNETLRTKKQIIHHLQFGLNREDISFLINSMNDKGLEIRTTSLLHLVRLEEADIVQNLNEQFHKFMEGSFHYSKERMSFNPVSSKNPFPNDQYSNLPLFTDYFDDDSLRWLILVHPREFSKYIRSESQIKRILSVPELHLLSGILMLSVTFHKDRVWAERLIKYWPQKCENNPSDTLPWASIFCLLTSETINQIVSKLLKENHIQSFVSLRTIAKDSNVIWSLNNSLDMIAIIIEILDRDSSFPSDELRDLSALGLRLDPRVFTKFDQSIDRVQSLDSLTKEVQIFRNTLRERFQLEKILLKS